MDEGLLNDGFTFVDFVEEASDYGKSLHSYLSERWPYRDWKALMERGKVSINNVVITDGEGTLLKKKDVIRFYRDPWREPVVDMSFTVAHQDEELIVVVKKKGMPIVPHGEFLQTALLHIVRNQGFPEAVPLHRLGRGTTGAIVFARNNAAAKKWCPRFAQRDVKKVYRCVVAGVPPWDAVEAECSIGPVTHPGCAGGVFAAVPAGTKGGKRALTRFSVVHRGPTWAVVDANIFTGRAHQIRIMTGWTGFPLLGDPLYGLGGVPKPDGMVFDESGHDRPAAPGDTGYLLHSMVLEIGHVAVRVAPPNLDEWAPYWNDWK